MVGSELNRTQRAQKENKGFIPRQFFARVLPSERLKQASFQATDAQGRSLNQFYEFELAETTNYRTLWNLPIKKK